MRLSNRAVALYGRFSPGVREALARMVARAGGVVARDLTRRSDVLVIGALAGTLIESGALAARLAGARGRGVPVLGERAFVDALAGDAPPQATLPLSTALAGAGVSREDADLLAAFDLIVIDGDNCRFGDAGVLRTLGQLLREGASRTEAVRILARTRDSAPIGRHRVVLTREGEPALDWDDGLTSLEGQGLLPLEGDHDSLDDLFERAALAEAGGRLDEAAHLYDQCARADRRDAIAPYNLANIRLAQGASDEALMAYQRALARDARFLEARYNLAQALEAAGKADAAAIELERVLNADAGYPDAVFNLAQLRMRAGDVAQAKTLYERYLALDPPADWAATARKAILYCQARLSA